LAPFYCIATNLSAVHKKKIFILFIVIPFLVGLISPLDGEGADVIVVNIILNDEDKGQFFVHLTDDGDYLIRAEDLRSMGFHDPQGNLTDIGGVRHISLRSMKGVSFTYNENNVSLEIIASPGLLPLRKIDLSPEKRPGIYYPKDTGGFLNYGFNYVGDNKIDFQSVNVSNQLGFRYEDLLFLTDSNYSHTTTDEKFVRLMSNITYETRKDLNRWVLGDALAASGILGSSVNLGGLSFSKHYQIDPYFIKQPMVDYTGFATFPTEMNMYIDGARVRSEKLTPGQFDLKNILAFSGAHDMEIVMKDAFGREQRLKYPFYIADTLLKKGLHEFSYNAGFLREDYAAKSNNYGRFAYTGFHRYGITDAITAGFAGEGTSDLYNLGPQITYLIGDLGVVSMSAAGSFGCSDKTGFASSFGYTYQAKEFNARLLANTYTKDYSVITTLPTDEKTRYELGAGIGYNTRTLGSLSFDFGKIIKYQGSEREAYTVNYTRVLTSNSSIYLSFRHTQDNGSNNQVSLGLTYFPWKDITLSLNLSQDKNTNSESLQIQKNAPTGEGYGYHLSAGRTDAPDNEANYLNPYFQYNGRYGIYSAEYNGQYDNTGTNETYQLSASGSMVYVNKTIGLSRPVSDSFGIVKVGDLKDITVYQNNQDMGKTDSRGTIVLPNLVSYIDNSVSINDKEMPINYSLSRSTVYIAPLLRSGTFLKFDTAKIQAVTGRLGIKTDGTIKPIEMKEIAIVIEGKKVLFPTGRDGEFYIENISPGIHSATVNYMNRSYIFSLTIPKSDDMIIDLGGVTIEDNR
jgi:outer membrane usher protein